MDALKHDLLVREARKKCSEEGRIAHHTHDWLGTPYEVVCDDGSIYELRGYKNDY